MSARELMVLITMCTIWSFHFVVIKLAVGQIPPLFYAAIRMSLVGLLLLPFLRWRAGQMRYVLLAGLCFGVLNYAFLFTGIANATAASAALAIELYVPFATILSVIFLGETVGIKRITGIAFAFVGVAIIALSKGEATLGFGIGLIACGAFFEAIGAIFVKKIKGFKPHQLLAWFALIGGIVLWGVTLTLEPGAYKAVTDSDVADGDKMLVVGAVLYSAIGASIIGHTSYYWLLQRLPLSLVAPSGLLTTLMAVFFAVIFLHEKLTIPMIVGAFMIIVGVGIVIWRNNKRAKQ